MKKIDYSSNSLSIYRKLYFIGNENSVEQTHKRIAEFIGNTDEERQIYFGMMQEKAFRPSTTTMMNSGREVKNNHDGQLLPCHVFGLEDSMESIAEWWKFCALTYASGAGVGANITNLREENSNVREDGFASGPISYCFVCQEVSKRVMSGGRKDGRRAANMAVANYNHPDIMKIVGVKQELDLSAFNISVSVSSEFMDDVMNSKFEKKFDLISPNKNKVVGQITVGELWNKIIENCHANGDPGLFFHTITNKYNPIPTYGSIDAVNVCGEVPTFNNTSCVLGTINLNNCFDGDVFDFDKLKYYVNYATRFLDSTIDKTTYINEKFKEQMQKTRSLGVGAMGLADALIRLKIPYNSQEGYDFFARVCKTMTVESIKTSIKMCKEGKKPLDIPSEDTDHFEKLLIYYGIDEETLDDFRKFGIRNIEFTSLPPNGSTAISAGCSFGFEPLTGIVWEKVLSISKEKMVFVYPLFEEWLDSTLLDRDKTINDIVDNRGSLKGIDYIPEEIQKIFVTAHDISPFQKIDMQSSGQRYITLGISSTCNVVNNTTKDEISDIYKYAFQKNLKGCTIYRDGSYLSQPMNFGKVKECKEEVKIEEYNRPIRSHADHFEYPTSQGKMHLSICKDEDNKIFQILIRLGKQGTLTNLLLDAMSRCISKALQYDVPLSVFAKTLRDNKDAPFWVKLNENDEKSTQVESVVDLIGIIFDMISQEDSELRNDVKIDYQKMERCPVCKEYTIIRDSGCKSGRCTNEKCLFTSCG